MIIKLVSFLAVIITACNAQKSPSDITIEPNIVIKSDTLAIKDTIDYSVDYIMGKFDPSTHDDFTIIPAKYRDTEIRYIRKDVLEAFIKMYDAAKRDGINLIILSATRNFDNQKRIWENKWTGKTKLSGGIDAKKIKNEVDRAKKILQYSSMPGTSRHHWGTDVDFNSLDNQWFESGDGLKLYTWMQQNAAIFGFCQPYTQMGSDRQTGYYEEKWHWTYMPISAKITQQAKRKITNDMVKGFLGSHAAMDIDILNNYILGISPSCVKN